VGQGHDPVSSLLKPVKLFVVTGQHSPSEGPHREDGVAWTAPRSAQPAARGTPWLAWRDDWRSQGSKGVACFWLHPQLWHGFVLSRTKTLALAVPLSLVTSWKPPARAAALDIRSLPTPANREHLIMCTGHKLFGAEPTYGHSWQQR
jgi:hypothetical protein